MKQIRNLGKHQRNMLEFSIKYSGWHSISSIDGGIAIKIALSLAKRGFLDVIRHGRNNYQFRTFQNEENCIEIPNI